MKLKTIAIAFAALLLLLTMAVVATTLLFDSDTLKTKAILAAKEKAQLDLVIDGPLGLSFLPTPGLRIEKATVSEKGQRLLSLESARVSVALLPFLLRREIDFSVDIGKLDLAGLPVSKKQPPPSADSALQPLNVHGALTIGSLKIAKFSANDFKIRVDLTTQGGTPAAMKKTLSGTASIRLKDGAMQGINLAQSLRQWKSFLPGQNAAPGNAPNKTDFSDLSASFRITKGVVHNEDLTASAPFLRLSGSGVIDLSAERLDYLLKARLVPTTEGQGNTSNDPKSGITVPVRLMGTFTAPDWKIEFPNLLPDTADLKAAITEKALTAQVKDKLMGKLLGR
ncbi:MAG: type II secretion system protein GspN [Rhodocyclaceae bacterium]|nr:type II secretion system protein GspN [Rhodocyclaceae bacterium]